MDFEVVGQIRDVETIALARSIRVLRYLRRAYGRGRWRKMKGVAVVRLPNGALRRAELHWYEANGIGKRDVKIKRYLDGS
jgi:hypothetical protein